MVGVDETVGHMMGDGIVESWNTSDGGVNVVEWEYKGVRG